MSNGARHTWGFFAGVVLTAALGALLIFGSYRLQHGYLTQFHKQDKWIGGGLLLGAGIVFAILASSRLSPVASLVGGIVFTAAGVLFFISQKTTADLINRFPLKAQRVTLEGLEDGGFILFAGAGLLFASFFPSRWRGRDSDDSDDSDYEYGGPETRESRSTSSYGAQDAYGGGRDTYVAGTRDAYSGPDAYGAQAAADSAAGRHATYDDQATTQSPYAAQHGSYEGYETRQQTSYDSPLYEPTQQQPYTGSGRAPYSPADESGGTREMRRPE